MTEPDTYTMCAIGAIPPASSPQRFVNTNCLDEDVEVTNTSTRDSLDLSIETGYYLVAPATPGTYRIFARLIAVATDVEALTLYESGFENVLTTNYAQIGTVIVN